MPAHKHNFMPLCEGKAVRYKESKYVLSSFYAACMCGAIKTVKVKTVNGIKIEKIIL